MARINDKVDQVCKEVYNGNNSSFARDFDTTDVTIRNYRISKSPKYDFLIRLVEELNISLDWLMLDKGDMFSKDEDQSHKKAVKVENSGQTSDYIFDLQKNQIKLLEEKNRLLEEKHNMLENENKKLEEVIESLRKEGNKNKNILQD